MNSDWTEIPLGELVTHKKGFAFKSQDFTKDGGRRVIRVSDTNATSIKTEDPVYLPEQKAQDHSDYELSHGDIILTTVGSRPPLYDSMVGKTIRVPKEIEGALLNQNMVKLSPKDGLVDPGFLYSVLKTRRFISHIEGSARGNANQASITLEDTFQFPVLVPSLSEQCKIAEILLCWDDGISLVENQINSERENKKCLLLALLGFESDSKDITPLLETLDILKDGTHGTHKEEKDGIPLLSAKDISEGEILVPENCRKISEDDYKVIHKNWSIDEGDVLLTTVGTLGRVAIYTSTSGRIAVQRSVAILRPKKERLLPEFLYQFTQTDHFQSQLRSRANASAQAGVYLGELAKIPIWVPSLGIQDKIVEVLKLQDRKISRLVKMASLLKQQKQALMQKLLTGKIRVKV